MLRLFGEKKVKKYAKTIYFFCWQGYNDTDNKLFQKETEGITDNGVGIGAFTAY